MLLYEGSFNPSDTEANLVQNLGHGFLISLDPDTDYILVTVDEFSNDLNYQLAVYEPGVPGLETHLNGAWFDPATAGQGCPGAAQRAKAISAMLQASIQSTTARWDRPPCTARW